MPISDGMGLVFSVTSYSEMIVISFTGCYEQLPDPEIIAQCLRDSFQEYLALLCPAARRKPRPAAVKTPQRKTVAVTGKPPRRIGAKIFADYERYIMTTSLASVVRARRTTYWRAFLAILGADTAMDEEDARDRSGHDREHHGAAGIGHPQFGKPFRAIA
jgi:hypothetical protein